jgi:hypothetical protein
METVEKVTLLRVNLEGTEKLNEKNIRSLCRGIGLKEFFERELVTFKELRSFSGRDGWTVQIELPAPCHFGNSWKDVVAITEIASGALKQLQERICEFNKFEHFSEVYQEMEC